MTDETKIAHKKQRWKLCSTGFCHSLVFALALISSFCNSQKPVLVMQKAADERDSELAGNTPDPTARLAAWERFIKIYPNSSFAERARMRRFILLLQDFPSHTTAIKQAAEAEVAVNKEPRAYIEGEAQVAERLTEAGAHGVLLPAAESWAKDSERRLKEQAWIFDTVKDDLKTAATVRTPGQLHHDFLVFAASEHVALADVYLHEGKLRQAKELLDQAEAAQPADISTNSVEGEYELARGNRQLALIYFERAAVANDNAELFSDLAKKYRGTLLFLYRESHMDSESGFEDALDERYKEMFPPTFATGEPINSGNGHVAMLELFTGSGCPPCVGADLAADALLNSYPRDRVIVLSFDEHMPRPDPLANPDSVARAVFYQKTASTPIFVLDGTPISVFGSSPDRARDLYGKLERKVVDQASSRTPAKLALVLPTQGIRRTVKVEARVQLGSEEGLRRSLIQADTNDSTKVRPRIVVNFALVEDRVRYSGENGLRFHRMVVRALAKPADDGYPVRYGKTTVVNTSFSLNEVSEHLQNYLDGYALSNDRYGAIQWKATPTTLDDQKISVVAWVQDLTTHQILQSAITPRLSVPDATTGANQ